MKGGLSVILILAFTALQTTDVTADASVSSPYGVHAHVTRGDEHPFLEQELARMQEANIRWLRTGFVWAAIERKEGQWDYAACDDVVAEAGKAGIQIMGLLHGTPRWARPTIEHLDQWLRFVRKTVERYKGRVPAWQVWNEPNLQNFWDDPNPSHYAKLLKATYSEIKQADPEALVVWGATSRLDWAFVEPALAEAGGRFDVMAIHPYGYGDPRAPEAYIPDALDELRVLMEKFGAEDKPIWFTEWGWPSHSGRRGLTDRQQGQYIARAYLLALNSGLERGFWYEFQERNESDEKNEDAFGMLEYDFKPKPAYRAYATLIKARPPGSKTIAKSWKTRLIYHLAWTQPDGVTIHAVWNLWGRWKSPRMTPVQLEGELVEAYDYLGSPLTPAKDPAGHTILPLDWGSPIYLVGPTNVAFR